jgi:hypothetical protein
MFAWKSSQGAFYYRCTNYHLHGKTGCTQSRGVPKATADQKIIETFTTALTLGMIDDVFEKLFDAVERNPRQDPKPIRKKLDELNADVARIIASIRSGEFASLKSELEKEAAAIKAQIEHTQGQLQAAEMPLDTKDLKTAASAELRRIAKDWLGYLTKNTATAQQVIRKMLGSSRIVVIPPPTKQSRAWEFKGLTDYQKLAAEAIDPKALLWFVDGIQRAQGRGQARGQGRKGRGKPGSESINGESDGQPSAM